MRSRKKNSSHKRAMMCLALGAYMTMAVGFTSHSINNVEISVDGKVFEIRTASNNPQDIFRKAGVELGENDEYVYKKDGDKTKLTVFRSLPPGEG